jgi:hypothetical protein
MSNQRKELDLFSQEIDYLKDPQTVGEITRWFWAEHGRQRLPSPLTVASASA